jgi:WD40 repeat protein/predicted Ser/Thr protein kinase
MNASEAKACPQCGRALPADAPARLCPQCLWDLGGEEASAGSTPPSAPPAGAEHRRFGNYDLLEEIGHGGMGVVYKARQHNLGRLVAVKMIRADHPIRPEEVRRFEQEAAAAATLQHPHIVAIHEAGEVEGQQFYSMDFVEGRSLAQIVGEHPLPARQAADYLKAIAEAVAYAHQRGILHRDLKPSNVLIDANDQPRIVDFGLAKSLPGSQLSRLNPQLTLSGQVLGSPSYMAPEQASGQARAVDARTDVYALGAILYELVSGRPPFEAETALATFRLVVESEPVSPRLLNPRLPPDLETICLKCLEKEPRRRYATARALAEDLGRFLRSEPILARPLGPPGRTWRWCRRKPVVAGLSAGMVAALVLGFAGVTWQWRRAEGEHQLQRRIAYAASMRAAQSALAQHDRGSAVSFLEGQRPRPDEKGDLRGIEWRYLWQEMRSDEARSFPHTNAVKDALLSPDGKLLVTACYDDKVRVWDLPSGRVIRQFDMFHFASVRKCFGFAPDGKWLVLPGADASVEIRETSGWRVINRLSPAQPPLCLSGDGRFVVADGGDVGREGGSLVLWNLNRGSQQSFRGAGCRYDNLAIAPGGSRIAFSAADPFWDTEGCILLLDCESGRAEPIATNVQTLCLAFSPDGKWLASAHYSGEVSFWSLPGGRLVERFAAHSGPVMPVTFSPDSSLLASGGYDQLIHLWETGTSNRRLSLQGHDGPVFSCAFSSDGQWLVSSSADATAKLWRAKKPPATSQSRQRFTLPTNTLPIGVLPDGTALLTADESARTSQLWSLADGRVLQSHHWHEAEEQGCAGIKFFAASQLAVGVSSNGTAHLWDLRTGAHVRSVALGASGVKPLGLSPDRRWLLGGLADEATGTTDAHFALWDLDSARRALHVRVPPSFFFVWGFSADSRWLAYTVTNGLVRIRDLAAYREKTFPLEGGTALLFALRFSPDNRVLAIGGFDGVSLWSLETARPRLERVMSAGQFVIRVSFSSDGKTLVGSGINSIWFWDVPTGQEMILVPNAVLASGHLRGFSLPYYNAQAEANPGGNLLLWQEAKGPIRVTPLPSLTEIDRLDKPVSDQETYR